ncbi:MAG: hypothetical protein ABH830_02305 [Patescibacteria group bacterium]
MKEKIKKYWWVIIIFLILSGAFYWFQWRPTQIRKECFKVKQETREVYSPLRSVSDEKMEEYAETNYQDCLRKHGLEK